MLHQTLPLTSRVTLEKSLSLPGSGHSHLGNNVGNNSGNGGGPCLKEEAPPKEVPLMVG